MNYDFAPYFVVYRYKDNPCDHSLYKAGFVTLHQLYAFIRNNFERWSEYDVGKTLEFWSLQYGSNCFFYNIEKPLFKRVVMCPDAFDIKAFHQNMKAVFGEKVIVNIIIT